LSDEETRLHAGQDGELLDTVQEALAGGSEARLKAALREVPPADVAAVLGDLGQEEQAELFRRLDVEVQAEVLGELGDEALRNLAEMTPRRLENAVSCMEPDEVADVLEALPDAQSEAFLERFPDEQAATAEQLLGYPADSAGGLMTTEFILLAADLTSEKAIETIRREREAETVSVLFVSEHDDRLAGYVPLHRIVFAPEEQKVGELVEECPLVVGPEADQEELVRGATRYDLSVVPVTDAGGRMIGVVTVDDILEAAEQEADEDMYRLAGTGERDPVHASVVRSTRLRLPWLLLSVLDGLFIAFVVSRFVDRMRLLELSFFLPLIPLMGGQVAIQGSTIVVRALAVGSIRRGRVGRFLAKQLVITMLLALCCAAAAGFLGGLVVGTGTALMLAVGLAVGVAIVFAGMLGMVFPFVFDKIGIDPAVSAGPFITMLNDLFCISIYLALGTMLAPPA